jgi:hypothetical protein
MNKKETKIFLFIGVLVSHLVFGQNKKRCAYGELSHRKVIHYAENQRKAKIQQTKEISEDKIIKIPVVVHVIHSSNLAPGQNLNTNSNISDEQIFSQIKVLNEDYRRKVGSRGFNDNPSGADMKIDFELAKVDPNGKSSSGIVRVFNSQARFDVFKDREKLAELSYWDSEKYLNIWVTSLSDDYLGYAEFPWGDFNGLELEETNPKIDGVVVDHTVFGNRIGTASKGVYSYGRSLSHEIGHWLGLIHIWGDDFCGDDYCNDTPTQERGNLSTKCRLIYSTCNGQRTLNMSENFMDYTPDSCMNVFTNDQSKRVREILELNPRRKKLVLNSMFTLPEVSSLELRTVGNPVETTNVRFMILTEKPSKIDLRITDLNGKVFYAESFIDTPSRLIDLNKDSFGSGVFLICINNGQKNLSQRIVIP